MSEVESFEKPVSGQVKTNVRPVKEWLSHLSRSWDDPNSMYHELLIDGAKKDLLLEASMNRRSIVGDIEDVIAALELALNKRIQSLKIDEDEWEVVFFGLYPIIQDYVRGLSLLGSDMGSVSPHKTLAVDVRALATWMHVYFS